MPPAPVGDTVESAMARTPLTVKSLNRLNVPMSSDLLGRLIRGSETLKRVLRMMKIWGFLNLRKHA